MEENFYLDDFELTLQEQANQFKMVPNKKVWHGIYNDLHPGRRWPSVMISLVLISSIVVVGYINSNGGKNQPALARQTTVKNVANVATLSQEKASAPASSINQGSPATIDERNKIATASDSKISDPIGSADISAGRHDKSMSQVSPQTPGPLVAASGSATTSHTVNSETALRQKSTQEKIKSLREVDENLNYHESFASRKNDKILVISKEATDQSISKINQNDVVHIITTPSLSLRNENQLALGFSNAEHRIIVPSLVNFDKEKMTLAVFDNKLSFDNISSENIEQSQTTSEALAALTRKKNNKISWTYYAGALVNTVSFGGSSLKESTNSNLSPLPQVTQKDMKVIRNAALGFEAGLQMNYSFAPRLRFTTGAHVTRSGYNIVSNLVHPTLATLTLKNTATGEVFSRSFVTLYGDGTGLTAVSLHNYSYQASVPVGLQYMMWENDKLQLDFAASIEPSLVFKSDAYLLSSDGKNYVNVPDLLRKWNFSSSFTPFVSFRSAKLKWSIGPTIRYQWLSTYEKSYTVKEHLIDYGIRIGISK